MQDTEESTDKSSKKGNEEILRIARERFRLAEEAEADIRRDALDDDRFSAGEQWPDQIKADRDRDGRPCLVINRLPQFIHQLTNDQKQNRPAIKVSPVDDNADVETAKIYQGLIRHIEYSSNADVAYNRGFNSTVRGGFGYWRVFTEYCDPMSFDQEIRIGSIRNRFKVYLDPNYQEPDGSDANWGFVFDDLSKDDYKAQHPDSKLTSMEDWKSIGDDAPGWATEKTARIAEYFYKEYEEVEIVLLSNGKTVKKSELPPAPAMLQAGVTVVNKRKAVMPVIKWCKLDAVDVIEETDWPGKWIPIIPVLGEEIDLDGKRILESVVRHAKDPQRMYNYWNSAQTEAIALAPRAPFIGYEGQFEGHEDQWGSANRKNHAFLQVKPMTIGGQPAPLPQRNSFEPAIQAIAQAMMTSSEDMKATTGIYDAALGNRSNENSGIAIQRRNNQTQTSNFHFVDNLNKSIRHTGRILVDLIPHIYDTARAVRILGEEGDEEVVRINEEFQHKGNVVRYDMGKGKYDVTLSTGPSFETKRQEASASMMEFTKAMPQVAAICADLIAKNQDWPGAAEFAERIKKTLPPGIADDKDQKPIPPQVKAQMEQQGQLIDQLTEQLKHKTEQIETKTLELESKERIEFAKIQANIEIEMAKMGSQEAQALLAHQVSEIQHRLDLLHMSEPIENENEPSAGPQMGQPPGMNQPQPTGGPSPGEFME